MNKGLKNLPGLIAQANAAAWLSRLQSPTTKLSKLRSFWIGSETKSLVSILDIGAVTTLWIANSSFKCTSTMKLWSTFKRSIKEASISLFWLWIICLWIIDGATIITFSSVIAYKKHGLKKFLIITPSTSWLSLKYWRRLSHTSFKYCSFLCSIKIPFINTHYYFKTLLWINL